MSAPLTATGDTILRALALGGQMMNSGAGWFFRDPAGYADGPILPDSEIAELFDNGFIAARDTPPMAVITPAGSAVLLRLTQKAQDDIHQWVRNNAHFLESPTDM